MSKKGQIFYKESKLKFYLRNSHSTHPCQIYLVASIDGKRYRIYTKMKVYASQWDQERQLAVISNVQSKQDNRNNKIANNYLNKLRGYFSEFIEYICNNNVDDIAEKLKQFINRDMAKKKINLVYVAADALEYYHNYVKPSIKDSTKRQSESLLSEFGRFVNTLREKDKTMQIFSQRGLNMYKEYLIDKMNKSKDDDNMRNFGVGQLNRCGAIIALLINKVLVPQEKAPSPVVWIKVDDPRREDQMGHIPLLDNEVAAIESCSGLTPVEEEYRDVFLLHLECGQRVSDLAKLLTGNYKVKQGKKYKYIVVSTTKENINAIIPITPKVTMLMDKIKNHSLVNPKEFEEKTKGKGNNTYNEAIRRIAKKAGLDREIVKIDSTQKEVRKPLYKTLSSHDARCTFITNMIRKGVSPERLCRMTGHANDEMIKRVYAQLTVEDEINRIESDIFCDIEENDYVSPTDISSYNPNESESLVHKELTATMTIFTDSESSFNFESDEVIEYENYISNLNDRVDDAINEINAALQGHDLDELDNNDELKSFIDGLENNKQWFKSKEDIIIFWQNFESQIKENADPDYPKIYLELDRLDYLRTLIDYLRSNHVLEDAIESLEELLHKICEENPDAFFISRFMSHFKICWPISQFYMVSSKMMQFIHENRPIADDTMFEDDNSRFKSRIDWNLVFNELQIIPAKKLDALIQNINCSHDVKNALYNSVKKGDFNTFSNTIKTHENDVRVILIYAYDNHFARKIIKQNEYLKNIALSGPENPIELITRTIEMQLLQNPYVDSVNDESIPDSSLTDVQEADIKEQLLWLLDTLLRAFDDSYMYAYPSEKKVFNKVRSLVDFNKYPELKEAYEDYKAKQNAADSAEISDDNSKPNEKNQKPEVAFEDLVIFKSEIDLNKQEPNEFLSSPNSSIIQRGDDVFKEFINFLVYSSCIDDNDVIKQLLVYRLTGRCRPKGELGKIPWNPEKLNELAYVIRYATARGAIGKYEKVRDFFEGPTFPEDISMIRTTADNASLDFRLKLNSLYPDVFTIKGAR